MHSLKFSCILPSFSGEHARAIADGSPEKAREAIDWYSKIFGEDLYIEVTKHPEVDGHEEKMKKIVSLARELKVDRKSVV